MKTRRSEHFGGGLGALDDLKLRRMARVAEVFVAQRDLFDLVPHFAVLSVEQAEDGATVRFVPDAFDAS